MSYISPNSPTLTDIYVPIDEYVRISSPDFLGATSYTWTSSDPNIQIVNSYNNHVHVIVSQIGDFNIQLEIKGDFLGRPSDGLPGVFTYNLKAGVFEDTLYLDYLNEGIYCTLEMPPDLISRFFNSRLIFQLLEKDKIVKEFSINDFKPLKTPNYTGDYWRADGRRHSYYIPMPLGYKRSDFQIQQSFRYFLETNGFTLTGSPQSNSEVAQSFTVQPVITDNKVMSVDIEITPTPGVDLTKTFTGSISYPYPNGNTPAAPQLTFTLVNGKLKASADLSNYRPLITSLTQDQSDIAITYSPFNFTCNDGDSSKVYYFTPRSGEMPFLASIEIGIAAPYFNDSDEMNSYSSFLIGKVNKWLYDTYKCFPLQVIDRSIPQSTYTYNSDHSTYFKFENGIFQRQHGEGPSFFAKGKIPFLIILSDVVDSYGLSQLDTIYQIPKIKVNLIKKLDDTIVDTLYANQVTTSIRENLDPLFHKEMFQHVYFIVEVDTDTFVANNTYYLTLDSVQFPRTNVQVNSIKSCNFVYKPDLIVPLMDLEILNSPTKDLNVYESLYLDFLSSNLVIPPPEGN